MSEETHSYIRSGPNGNTFLTGRLGEPATCCGWIASLLCDYAVYSGKMCAHNGLVAGSSPAWPTIFIIKIVNKNIL